jgi:hypothetical protein
LPTEMCMDSRNRWSCSQVPSLTICQVPVILQASDEQCIKIYFSGGSTQQINGYRWILWPAGTSSNEMASCIIWLYPSRQLNSPVQDYRLNDSPTPNYRDDYLPFGWLTSIVQYSRVCGIAMWISSTRS